MLLIKRKKIMREYYLPDTNITTVGAPHEISWLIRNQLGADAIFLPQISEKFLKVTESDTLTDPSCKITLDKD